MGGGVILTNNASFASLIRKELDKYPRRADLAGISNGLTGITLSLFLNPERYAIPANLPFLNLGANIFDPNFKIARFPNLNAAVGQQTFSWLKRYNEIRIQNAHLINKNLSENRGLKIPKPNHNGRSVYLRFPILFKNKDIREKALKLLTQQRLGASTSYPTPLNQIGEFKKSLVNDVDFRGAQFVSDRILTLPTHPYVKESDIEKIVSIVHSVTC